MLPKHKFIYRAVAEAIDGFGERHYITGRAHFAPIAGYRGKNGHIQISTMLNSSGYNPANPKRMSVDQLAEILEGLDDEGREHVLEAIVNEYGFNLCKSPEVQRKPEDAMRVMYMALGIESVHGNLAETLVDALEDGEIDEEERERITKATFALRKAVRELEEALR